MRMGLHVNGRDAATAEAFANYVQVVRPPWVKFIGDGMDARMFVAAKAAGCKIIGRKVFGDGEQKLGNGGAGNIDAVVRAARERPEVDAWELHNESWDNPGEIGRYAALSIDFMDAMEAIGKRAVIGCFSTGTPEVEEWKEYLPALKDAWRRGHYVAVHEYSAPTMTYMAGLNQWNNGNPRTDDPAVGADVQGYQTLRYRKLFALAKEHKIGVRLLITESGNDDIRERPGPQAKGWRDWRGTQWAQQMPYHKQWGWYCAHLTIDAAITDTGKPVDTDHGVHGVMDFGFGAARARTEWAGFDLEGTDEFDKMKNTMLTLPRGHAAMLPPTAPAPVPPPAPPPPPPILPQPPTPPVAGPAPAFLKVTVQPDENWYAVVRRVYNLPLNRSPREKLIRAIRALASANGLDYTQTSLVPGQILVVPGWATLWPEEYDE